MINDENDFLEIPPFVRRTATPPSPQPGGGEPPRRAVPAKDSPRPDQVPPEAQAPEGYKLYLTHNGYYDRASGKVTEVRSLPSGRRHVYAKRGRKWAYIWRGRNRHRIKMRRAAFDEIVVAEEPWPQSVS